MKLFKEKLFLVRNSRYRKVSFFFLLLLFFLSIITYVNQPFQSEVSMPLFYSIVVMVIVSNIVYFKTKKTSNYLSFDPIFITIYNIVGFSTTFFWGNTLLYKALFIGFPVSEIYINRGNLLFLIGLQSYMLGSLSISNYIKNINENANRVINTKFLTVFVLFLILLFISTGGISHYKSIYTNTKDAINAGISIHVLVLLLSTAIVVISTELYNKKISPTYKVSKFTLLFIFLLILMLLWAGNRTAASQLMLPLLCIYAMYFYNIKFKQFLLFVFCGICAMWIIQNTRSNRNLSISNLILIITDLTIPARVTYSAIDYAEQNGYTYGKTMSLGIIGIIPFLPSSITKGDTREFGSAELLTNATYETYKVPVDQRIGLGTTIIGDIYLSFGLIGVILLMYLLGYFINTLLIQSINYNYFSIIVFAAMLANSVFLVRASYTHAVRFVIWALTIAYINKIITSSLNEK
jgi:oligosaccharide repeat unit polymerase